MFKNILVGSKLTENADKAQCVTTKLLTPCLVSECMLAHAQNGVFVMMLIKCLT